MFDSLMTEVRSFVRERDWEQFHSPKNLAAAISVEAAELLEHFMWDSPDFKSLQQSEKRKDVEHELADIIIYCLEFYSLLGSDPEKCIMEKVALNRQKYPVEKAKGVALKYDAL